MPTYQASDGAVLHYDERGTGRPLVAIAGGAARDPIYLGDLGGIGEGRRLIVPHLRGVGSSAVPTDPAVGSWWNQASDLEALRIHLGEDHVDVIAHSAGTRLATSYAARYGDRVSRMLLVTPPSQHLVDVASDVVEIARRRSADAAFEAAVALLQAGPPLTSETEFNEWQRAIAPAGYAHWGEDAKRHSHLGSWDLRAATSFFSVAPPADFVDRLRQCTASVLVIAGADDVLTGLAPVVALSRLFPNGKVEVLADCGHYPWIEQPERFTAAVVEFLREPFSVEARQR